MDDTPLFVNTKSAALRLARLLRFLDLTYWKETPEAREEMLDEMSALALEEVIPDNKEETRRDGSVSLGEENAWCDVISGR